MSAFELGKTRVFEGVWEGVLTRVSAGGDAPDLRVLHGDQPVAGVELAPGETADSWTVRIPIPKEAITDGVQTITVFDGSDDSRLGHVTLLPDDAMADDIRAEMDLLRAVLDMLKRAFRRHCVDTA